MLLNSIRWRLQLWHGLLLVVVLAGFGLTAYQLQRSTQLRRIDEELQARLTVAGGLARRAPEIPGRPPFDRFPPNRRPEFSHPRTSEDQMRGGEEHEEKNDYSRGATSHPDRPPRPGDREGDLGRQAEDLRPREREPISGGQPPFDQELPRPRRELSLTPQALKLFESTG